MMKKKLSFRKRGYCSVVAVLSLFAVCGSNLHAASNSSPEGIMMDVNDSQRSAQEPKVGTKAPDFTVTKEGKSVSLTDLGSMLVVVNFSSTSPESRKITADAVGLEEKYKNADIAFVNISLDENADIAKQYGVTSAPAVCIINPDGVIVSIDYGNVDLSKKLKDIFGM